MEAFVPQRHSRVLRRSRVPQECTCTSASSALDADDARDCDRFGEALWIFTLAAANRLLLNLADDVEAGDDAAEGGGALRVREAFPAEVERRLIVEEDEELGGRRVGAGARHRDRADDVLQPGDARPLERNRLERLGIRREAAL